MRSFAAVCAMLAIAALLLFVYHSVSAVEVTHFHDDFEGDDGPLDPRRWQVSKLEPASNATVQNGSARVYVKGWDRVVAIPDLAMDIYPFRVEFTWLQEAEEGNTLEIQVASSEDSVRWVTEEWFYYEATGGGWYHGDPTRSEAYQYRFSDAVAQVGTWYRVELTVEWSRVTIQVFEPGTDEPIVDREYYSVMDQYATVKLGAWAGTHALTAARIDDLRVYTTDGSVKAPIEVDPLPTVTVTEDVPRTFDLAPFVHDPDGDGSDLRVESNNHHIVDITGLNVTFLCLEDGGSYEVRLTFTDGDRFTDVFATLVVQGVNDPPELTLVAPLDGRTLYDVEHLRIEFSVTDPDSDAWESYVYVTGDDVEYHWDSEGVVGSSRSHVETAPLIVPGTYDIGITITDGEAQDSVRSRVYVEATEAPVIDTPDTFDSEAFMACLVVVLFGAVIIAAIVMAVRPGRRRYLDQAQLEALRARRLAKKARTPSRRPSQQQWSRPPPVAQMGARPPQAAPQWVSAPTPLPTPAPSSPPRAPAGDWRVGTVEEFMRIIPELPDGFPEPLWGVSQGSVGEQMVRTSVVGPDGRPYCYVNGKAYHADKRDLDSFLQPL